MSSSNSSLLTRRAGDVVRTGADSVFTSKDPAARLGHGARGRWPAIYTAVVPGADSSVLPLSGGEKRKCPLEAVRTYFTGRTVSSSTPSLLQGLFRHLLVGPV